MADIRDRIVELRRVPASELRANPRNWRTHPKAQRDVMSTVLGRIGYADALLARETPDGLEIIDGHLRAETTPDAVVPVLILDVDEAEANEILLTHDPLAAMAGTDDGVLKALIASVQFGDTAVDAMLAALLPPTAPRSGNTDPDDVPSTPAEPTTKRGDLWLLGDHRLLCGDSTNAEDVARLLDGAKPMMMVTDPPYGVEYDPAWRAEAGVNQNTQKMGKVSNDDRADWREAWALFPGIIAYVWHAGLHAGVVADSLTACDFGIRSQIIWAKDRFALSRGDYHWQHEPCWYGVKENHRGHRTGKRNQSTVWRIGTPLQSTFWEIEAREDSGHGHSTQKPVECMERPIRNHDAAGIYEPFSGSGTTIIAAERQGRRCYAMEIEPRYVDVAVKRWEQYTGRQAERVSAVEVSNGDRTE